MLVLADPGAGGELLEQATIEPARRAQIGVLDHCVLAQPGLTQPASETLALPGGRLAVDQQAKPVFARQVIGGRVALHLDERVGHGGQAEAAQALDHGVDQHGISFQ